MPWTFSHPAAVLPLKRFCPRYLSFPGLLAGSLMPDFGYYIGHFGLARHAHTVLGGVYACLPPGLVLLLLLALLRDPLLFLLPRRHRDVVGHVLTQSPRLTLRTLGIVCASIVIGAWSHITWDAFTHDGRWGQVYLPWLGEVAWTLGGADIPFYAVVQHASTLFGALVIVLGYRRRLHRVDAARQPDDADMLGDVHRWNLILTLVFASASIAVVTAGIAAQGATSWHAVHVFAFAAAIHGTVAFILLYTVTALMIYGQLGRHAKSDGAAHGVQAHWVANPPAILSNGLEEEP